VNFIKGQKTDVGRKAMPHFLRTAGLAKADAGRARCFPLKHTGEPAQFLRMSFASQGDAAFPFGCRSGGR
jgi:hypothetical protein